MNEAVIFKKHFLITLPNNKEEKNIKTMMEIKVKHLIKNYLFCCAITDCF